MPDQRRRAALASIGTAAVTVFAGCNSTSNNSNDSESGDATAATNTSTSTQSSNADVFEAVEPTTGSLPTENEEGAALDVALTDTSISAVTLRNSNGSEVARRELATGTATQLPLTGLKAGAFDVVAVKNGNVVGEQSITLERSFEVDNITLAKSSGVGSDKQVTDKIALELSNTGDLPTQIEVLRVEGDVPNPTPPRFERPRISGRATAEFNPGESMTVTSRGSPLTGDSDELCTGESRSADVVLETAHEHVATVDLDFTLFGSQVQSVGSVGCQKSSIQDWTVSES
ncbi:hypothetical protein [Halobacterium noricense]|uniref:hypothetical protein n=1 Tax=Halobacterium noricense TaxID=223182 RepID=UPI001E56B16F|nr:hypothetical protein [Halobacterium noricense]UHH27283.1 hypothetical protein LT974_17450 [Halobacterium noricense]